jgi:UrcA family protein
MKSLLTLAAAATTIAFFATPAAAQTPIAGNGPLVVSYADLDLRTEAGVRTLDRRIRIAVQQACGPVSAFDPAGKNRARECEELTLAATRAQRDVAIAAAPAPSQVQLAAQR